MEQDVEESRGGSRIPLALSSASKKTRVTPPPRALARSPRSPPGGRQDDWGIGQRVCINGSKEGFLRFVGETHFAPGLWCGVELLEPLGKNDGSIDGVIYFHCRPNYGLFAPHSKVEPLFRCSPDSLVNNSFEEYAYQDSPPTSRSSNRSREEAKKSPIERSMIPILVSPKRKSCPGDTPSPTKSKSLRPFNGTVEIYDEEMTKEVDEPQSKPLIRTRSFVIEKKSEINGTPTDIPTIDPNQTYTLVPDANLNKSTEELPWKEEGSVADEGDEATFTFDESLGILSSNQMDDFTLCAADRTLSECFAFPNSESLNDIHELPEHEEINHFNIPGVFSARSMLGLTDEDFTLIQDQSLGTLEYKTINDISEDAGEDKTLSLEFEPCHISTPTDTKEFEELKMAVDCEPDIIKFNNINVDLEKEVHDKDLNFENSSTFIQETVLYLANDREDPTLVVHSLNDKEGVLEEMPNDLNKSTELNSNETSTFTDHLSNSDSIINNNDLTSASLPKEFNDFETSLSATKDSFKSNIAPLMDNIESNLTALEMNLEANLSSSISSSANYKEMEETELKGLYETKFEKELDITKDLSINFSNADVLEQNQEVDFKADYNVLPTPLLEKKLESELVSLNKMLEDLEIEVLSAKKKNEASFTDSVPEVKEVSSAQVQTTVEDEESATKPTSLSDHSSSELSTIKEIKSELVNEDPAAVKQQKETTPPSPLQSFGESKDETTNDTSNDSLIVKKEELSTSTLMEADDSSKKIVEEQILIDETDSTFPDQNEKPANENTLKIDNFGEGTVETNSLECKDQEELISTKKEKEEDNSPVILSSKDEASPQEVVSESKEVVLEEVTIELDSCQLRTVYSKRKSHTECPQTDSSSHDDSTSLSVKPKTKETAAPKTLSTKDGKAKSKKEADLKKDESKPPKKNVMSKIKAMLEATSLGGRGKNAEAAAAAKKGQSLPKKSRWEAMTAKFSSSSESKSQIKSNKEVKNASATLLPASKRYDLAAEVPESRASKRTSKTLDSRSPGALLGTKNQLITSYRPGKADMPSSRSTSPLTPSDAPSIRSKAKGPQAGTSSIDSGTQSKLSKGHSGRKSMTKPFLFSRKSQSKQQAAAADKQALNPAATFSTRQELAQEIARLGSLCESRTKELNLLKLRLRHAVLGFDAFAVVVKYMAEELKAFSHPSLAEKLQRTEEELRKAELQLENYQKELKFLKEQHANELTELSKRLEQTHQKALDQLFDKHKAEITALKLKHSEEVKEIAGKYSLSFEGEDASHDQNVKMLNQQFNRQIEELEQEHKRQLSSRQADYERHLASLTQQIARIRQQSQALRCNLAQMEENFHKDADSKVQWLLSKKSELEKEVDSLKAVLEMKNSELHSLRTENMENKKELEKMALYKEKIKMLEAKTEDLQALVDEKVRVQRELCNEHQQLRDHFEKEAMVNKRLSMENEELVWKLKQTAETTYLLSSMSGDSTELMEKLHMSPLKSPPSSPTKIFFQYAPEPDSSSPSPLSPRSPIRKIPCPQPSGTSPVHLAIPTKKSKLSASSSLPADTSHRSLPPKKGGGMLKKPSVSSKHVENGGSHHPLSPKGSNDTRSKVPSNGHLSPVAKSSSSKAET